ncbi:MAG TPA: ABC transporter permease, partial [Puia sp.]
RKVLGATVPNIVNLLTKDFLKLVSIAIVVASPIAWFVMHKWLQDFAYRIPIAWWVFAIAAFAAAFIAVITVSFQAIRAAVSNPADSLRTE